jgi:hypothetical protein
VQSTRLATPVLLSCQNVSGDESVCSRNHLTLKAIGLGVFGCSASLHRPGEIDGRPYRVRLRPIEIGLDLVVCLHARRHSETVRVLLEEVVPLTQRDPNHHRVVITHAYNEAVMDVPRRTRLGSLAFDLRQRLRVPSNLVEGHV